MARERIFISGQVSGLDYDTAKNNFTIAENVWRGKGYDTVNPTRLCGRKWPWVLCMCVCLFNLLRCGSVYFIPNFRNSRGAKIEYRVAKFLNKTMYVGNFHTPETNI